MKVAWRAEYDEAYEAATSTATNERVRNEPPHRRVIIRKAKRPETPVMVIRAPRDGGWGWEIFLEDDPISVEQRKRQVISQLNRQLGAPVKSFMPELMG